jgi:hypothetical protein
MLLEVLPSLILPHHPKSNHETVCVLNGGQINGVQCFSVDQERGLTVLENTTRSLELKLTTPPSGPAGGVSHIIFSEDGKRLIVAVKGVPPQSGQLAVWEVGDRGALSERFVSSAPGPGGLLPFSLSVIPGKNAVLNTDASVGFSVFNFGRPEDENLVGIGQTFEIRGQNATCWSSFSPKTENIYLTDIGTNLVTEVTIDENLNAGIVRVRVSFSHCSSRYLRDSVAIPTRRRSCYY